MKSLANFNKKIPMGVQCIVTYALAIILIPSIYSFQQLLYTVKAHGIAYTYEK